MPEEGPVVGRLAVTSSGPAHQASHPVETGHRPDDEPRAEQAGGGASLGQGRQPGPGRRRAGPYGIYNLSRLMGADLAKETQCNVPLRRSRPPQPGEMRAREVFQSGDDIGRQESGYKATHYASFACAGAPVEDRDAGRGQSLMMSLSPSSP